MKTLYESIRDLGTVCHCEPCRGSDRDIQSILNVYNADAVDVLYKLRKILQVQSTESILDRASAIMSERGLVNTPKPQDTGFVSDDMKRWGELQSQLTAQKRLLEDLTLRVNNLFSKQATCEINDCKNLQKQINDLAALCNNHSCFIRDHGKRETMDITIINNFQAAISEIQSRFNTHQHHYYLGHALPECTTHGLWEPE
jgi:hypothetical protein